MSNDDKYQKEYEESWLISEYGTTDPRKIEKIKKERKSKRNFWILIIVVGLLVYMAMGGIQKCAGYKGSSVDSEWQYRHTDGIK